MKPVLLHTNNSADHCSSSAW